MANSKQGRNFQGVVYPDAENYSCDSVLAVLGDVFTDFAYILHDQDLDTEGKLKKPHYHWLGKRATPVSISVISKQLGVPDNAVEFCRSYRTFLRYLVHLDHPDKYQYPVEAVQGVFNRRLLLGDTEQAFIVAAVKAMQDENIRTVQALAAYACRNDSWTDFRRNYSILKDIMHEMSCSDVSKQWAGVLSDGSSGGGPFELGD